MDLVRKCGYLMGVAVLCFASSALADTVNLDFTGPTYSGPIGPYTFYVNGSSTPTPLICDDDLTYINYNETWTANVTTVQDIINTFDPTGTTPGAWVTTATYANSKISGATVLEYEEEAWLAIQLFTVYDNHGDTTDLQYAIWDLFDGCRGESGSDPLGCPSPLIDSAASAVAAGGINYSEVKIYTWVGNTGTLGNPYGTDPPQQFAGVPEASTSVLLGAGLLGLLSLMFVGKGRTV